MTDEKCRSSVVTSAAAKCEAVHESEILFGSKLGESKGVAGAPRAAQGSRLTWEQFRKSYPVNESSELLCLTFFPWLSDSALPLGCVN